MTAKQSTPLEEKSMLDFVKVKLPDYPLQESQKKVVHEVRITNGKPEQHVRDMGWSGVRCKTKDGLYVAQFNRDGFVFSRLKPYENWSKLKNDALRLWKLYAEATGPSEIQRLGLRYINVILIPPIDSEMSTILKEPPKAPEKLPSQLVGLMDQDTFVIPDHPFVIQIIKTVQPAQAAGIQGNALIIDIDVSTTKILESNTATLENHLDQMRWLKNTAFFGILTEEAVKTFK